MRTTFVWFALLIVIISIGDSLSNKNNHSINKQSYEWITDSTRRLLVNEARELRKKRKQEARNKLHEINEEELKQETETENKDKNVNNDVNNGVKNDNNKQPEEKIYRDYEDQVMDTIHNYMNNNNQNIAENTDKINDHDENIGENSDNIQDINGDNSDNSDNNIGINSDNKEDTNGDNIEDKPKNKRIYRYKFKNGVPNFGETVNENNVNYREDIRDNNDNDNNYPAIAKPVVKSFKSPFDAETYNKNGPWSKRTFWLLVFILIINIFSLLYCMYGRQIKTYINAIKEINNINIKPAKKLSDSDSDDDTTDEQYIE